LRTNQKRLGFIFAGLDQTDGWARWQICEKILRVSRVEFNTAIQFQHNVRILRGTEGGLGPEMIVMISIPKRR